jgi:hypothetical protein
MLPPYVFASIADLEAKAGAPGEDTVARARSGS